MQYFLRDHLGSVRVIAEDRHTVISRTDYLPFGVRMSGDGLTAGNPTARSSFFGFSGKENEMWGGYDTADGDITPHWLRGERYQHFGARAYDPVSCIFMQVDPMAEKYYGMTSYGYCAGNPVMMVDPDGQRVFFAKGVSDKFKKSFAATVKYMNKKGTSDGLFKLERSQKDYYIDEVQGESSSFSTIGNKNTIFWNSSNIISSRNGIWRSPATSLDHEIAHAVHYDTDPQGFISDIGTPDTDYATKEERNVIVGREQSTARKHGEIRNDQVTRTDYYGKTVSGDVSDKSPEEIELIIQSQNELL